MISTSTSTLVDYIIWITVIPYQLDRYAIYREVVVTGCSGKGLYMPLKLLNSYLSTRIQDRTQMQKAWVCMNVYAVSAFVTHGYAPTDSIRIRG